MQKLTVKQQKWCDYYIELGNATAAAIKAGYSKKTAKAIGAENLTKPYLSDYVAKRLEAIQSESIANQEEILQYLTSIMRGEKREQTLIGHGMGEQGITEIDVSAKDRIKAAELLGKRYAMWTEKTDLTATVQAVIVDDVNDWDEESENGN